MKHWIIIALAVCGLALHGMSFAQAPSKEETAKVWADAKAVAKDGPTKLELTGQAVLNLPANQVFVPQPQAGKLLNAMGNPGQDSRLQGLIFPKDDAPWFMTVRYESSGYIKDDDAKDWNADDLLKSYREGTEASNEERVKMGVPALEIVGWAEKPAYNATTHRLVWAMSSRDKGSNASENQGVNYNTYALGRDGYFSMNLVTDLKALPEFKPTANRLLDALEFNEGKRYADFNAKTDRVAEYGLAALVLGVAAKKLGLFAVIAVFLAKFAKVIAVAVFAFGGGLLKWFRKKPATSVHSGPEPAALASGERDTAVSADGTAANASQEGKHLGA